MDDLVAAELARSHPEVQRLMAAPEYERDAGYRLAAEHLRMFLRMLYRACSDEGLDVRATTRIVNRTVYGDPDGPPPSRDPQTRIRHLPQVSREQLLGLREGSGRQLRTPGDGLGPLTPTDYVAEQVPIRVEGPPAFVEKVKSALQPLTDPARQEAWLLQGGEERAAAGPPPGVQRRDRLPTDPTQTYSYTSTRGEGYVWRCSCGAPSRSMRPVATPARAIRLAQEHHRKKHPGIVPDPVTYSGEAPPS